MLRKSQAARTGRPQFCEHFDIDFIEGCSNLFNSNGSSSADNQQDSNFERHHVHHKHDILKDNDFKYIGHVDIEVYYLHQLIQSDI